jgi:hypothetical protein
MLASNHHLSAFLKAMNINYDLDEIIEKTILNAKNNKLTIHPYGFYIIKPFTEKEKQIRLHVWLDSIRKRQEPDWPPHNHNYDINSYVLMGKVTNFCWSAMKNPSSRNVIYTIQYNGSKSHLIKTANTVKINLISEQIVTENHNYDLKKDVFHSIEVDYNKPAVTLCIMSNPSSRKPNVIGEINGKEKYTFLRESLNKNEKIEVLKILSQIKKKYT